MKSEIKEIVAYEVWDQLFRTKEEAFECKRVQNRISLIDLYYQEMRVDSDARVHERRLILDFLKWAHKNNYIIP